MAGVISKAVVSAFYCLKAQLPATATAVCAAFNVPTGTDVTGSMFFCTDTKEFFGWDGLAMNKIGPSAGGGVTLPINESDVTNLVSDLAGKASTGSVTAEASARATGDATTLATAEAYTDSSIAALPASPIKQTITSLSTSQINNLATTPITLVPAPGNGFFVYPISIQVLMFPGATPYAGGSSVDPFVVWGNTTTPNITDDPDAANPFASPTASVTQFDVFKKEDSQQLSLANNQPLCLVTSIPPNIGGSILTSHVNPAHRGTGYAPGDTGQLNEGSTPLYTVTSVNGNGGVTGYTLTAGDIGQDAFQVGVSEGTFVGTGDGDGDFSIIPDTITQGNGHAKVVCTYTILPTS